MSNPNTTPTNFREIFVEVQNNLYEANLRWFSQDDIWASMQEAYNKVVAILAPIERSTFIPQTGSPYYDLAAQIPDFMYISGIYNPTSLLWLRGMSYKIMKQIYTTYLAIGNPDNYNVQDFRRIIVWPYLPSAYGTLYIVYKASAPKIYRPGPTYNGDGYYDWDGIPQLPYSVAKQLIEYFTMADLFEQARKFIKAQVWWDKLLKPVPDKYGTSILDQARKEISDLARADREAVLEPYRWIFHGGNNGNVTWINNETLSGVVDGINPTFTLAQVPNPTSSVLLMKNGVCLFEGVGYTINGVTVTYQTGYIPQPPSGGDLTGDLVRAWYQIN